MHYLLQYELASDYLERRGQYRAEHLRMAWEAVGRCELILGGALADPVDTAVLLFQGSSPEVAERFARADPYVQSGLVVRWRVRPWTTVVGEAATTPTKPADLEGKDSPAPGDGSTKAAATPFGGVTPILRVRDLRASIDFYVNVLGFKLDWQDPSIFASVSRGRCGIFFCEGDQGNPGTWLFIGVPDVEPLFEDFRAKGATVRHPPTNHPWAYEMQIQDPDGHVLRFGSDPKPDLPFGEWLDSRGVRWTGSRETGWTRVEPG
jgi:catechol 2,3-dioxygenase-like lactoylglutathione lyase family enzyme/uncharacterized protein YciI